MPGDLSVAASCCAVTASAQQPRLPAAPCPQPPPTALTRSRRGAVARSLLANRQLGSAALASASPAAAMCMRAAGAHPCTLGEGE